MATIRVNKFSGIRPAVADWNLDPSNALVCHNAITRDTSLRPFMQADLTAQAGYHILGMSLPTDVQGQTASLLTFPYRVSVTEAADPGYVSGFNHVVVWPHVDGVLPHWREISSGDVAPLGVAAPNLPLTVTRTVPTAALATSPDERVYTYTWVDVFGVESLPAPPTAVGAVYDREALVLTGFDTPPDNAVACRIYRNSTLLSDGGKQGQKFDTSFQLVAEVETPFASYTDSAALSDIAWGTLPTAENGPVPSQLEQVLTTTLGHYVAFSGNELFVSERHQPWNWPERLRFELPDRVIGICVHEYTVMRFGEAHSHTVVFVATTGRPYRMSVGMSRSGDHAETIADPAPFMEHLPCLQRETLAASELGAVYVSTEGLILLTPAGEAHRVTRGRIDEDMWQEYMPNIACWHRGRYYATRAPNGPGIIVDITADAKRQPELLGVTTVDLPAQVLHAGRDGRLYYASGEEVFVWNESLQPLTYTWRSKRFAFAGSATFGAARLRGDFGTPVNFALVSKGVVRYSRQVSDGRPFKLPALARQDEWQIEVRGSSVIHEIVVGSSFTDLAVDNNPTGQNQ